MATRSTKKTEGTAKRAQRFAHLKPCGRSQGAGDYLPGVLMVRCTEDVVANTQSIGMASVASVRSLKLPEAVEGPFLAHQEQIREVIPVFSRLTAGRSLSIAPTTVAASFATSVQDAENEDLRGINMLRLSSKADIERVRRDLEATPGIAYVHRVPRRWLNAPPPATDDPLIARQWGLRAVAWLPTLALDASSVRVAVLDTGIDLTHPDLRDVVSSYIHENSRNIDIVGHGTHVAGIIAAEINNAIGIVGMCRCDLNVWKIFSDTPDPDDGRFYVDPVLYQRALNAARNAGARVMNLSIGGTASSPTEALLFGRLIASGCTVVAAMGNEHEEGNPVEFPAAYPDVIAVGAVDETLSRASFSCTGKHISLCAPGVNILSTLPMQASSARTGKEIEYGAWAGTSMASPHVAAAAALVLASEPDLTPSQVAQRLIAKAQKVAAMNGHTFTEEYGHGLLRL